MIDDTQIDILEELSRLKLSPEEKASYKSELNSILGYVSKLDAADVGSVPFSFSENENRMRDDVVTNETGGNTAAIIEEAPESDGNYIKVKKVL